MPLGSDDDFGFVKPHSAKSRKAPGIFTPRNLIGRSIWDTSTAPPPHRPLSTEPPDEAEAEPRFNGIRDLVKLATSRRQSRTPATEPAFAAIGGGGEEDAVAPATPAASSREGKVHARFGRKYSTAGSNANETQADELVFNHDIDCSGQSQEVKAQEEAQVGRRLKKPIISADGKIIDAQRCTTNCGRPSGLRHIDSSPAPQKHPHAGSKRQFSWIHRPTAWNNPVTYEDPPEPGKRPSHPVCANGPVALDRMRSFPEKMKATGQWQNQWQTVDCGSVPEEGEEKLPVSDAPAKKSENYNDTRWLTNWHWHSRQDVDPPKVNKYSLGVPIESCKSARAESVRRSAAGKTSNLQAEGCSLAYYEQVRRMDEARAMTPSRAMTPLSAR